MKTTTRIIASLALLLALGCGSKSPSPAPAPAPKAPRSKIAAMSDVGCQEAPVEAEPAVAECTAE